MRIQPSILAGVVAATLALGTAWAEQKPVPTNPGQPSGSPTSTPTWTVPGAQPSNVVIKEKSPRPDPAARENGACEPPYVWSSSLKRCVMPLNSPMNPNNPAAIQSKSISTDAGPATGTPTSTPTHTVPAAPSAERLVIKTKSSPPVAPQNPGQIEERSANPGQPSGTPTSTPAAPSVGLQPTKDIKPDGVIQTGGNPGNPWDPQGKCYVGLPPKHYRCPQGQVMVDLDPSPKVCWRCVVPME